MEYAGRTPKEAIEKAKSWLATQHQDRPDLAGGLFYAEEFPNHHPFRRFLAGYVKGMEKVVASNCNNIDGYFVVKPDLQITSWRQWG